MCVCACMCARVCGAPLSLFLSSAFPLPLPSCLPCPGLFPPAVVLYEWSHCRVSPYRRWRGEKGRWPNKTISHRGSPLCLLAVSSRLGESLNLEEVGFTDLSRAQVIYFLLSVTPKTQSLGQGNTELKPEGANLERQRVR